MFSTTANEVMVDPLGLGHDSTLFVAGDDEAARAEASALARELGWTDILDLGDLTAARGLEMWMPLWLRLYGAIGQRRVQHQSHPLTRRRSRRPRQ